MLGFLGGNWNALEGYPRAFVLLLGGALAGYFLIVFALIPLARLAELTRLAEPTAPLGHKPAGQKPGASVGEQDAAGVVGTLAFDASTQWSAGIPADSKARVGQRYALAAGRVSVALARGAQTVIEGPAQWQFDSDSRLQLDAGQLAAYVPPQAVGFTVTTPAAEVLDLGTEFDLEVGPNGETQVYVVTGKVALKKVADEGSKNVGGSKVTGVQVVAGSAVRISAPGDVQSIPFDSTRLSPTRVALNAVLRRKTPEVCSFRWNSRFF